MKNTLIIIMAIACFNVISAQKDVNIEFTTDKNVILNGTTLTTETSVEDIKTILGTPTVYKSYSSGKTNYHYNDLGIAFHTVKDKLLFIGVNFNWDGDKTFPENSYTGTFKIDDLLIDKTSGNSIIDNIKMVDVIAIMPNLYMSNPKVESTPMIIGFKDDVVTQIGFEFH
ncbi:DUF7738 domain-containing protein [Psychroserpens damuponensis]|uniref:DUF7738 domain-containing protein n=1 Tax=Psychroserpens damuponensis TaxID=943936 RepID=UPI000590017B|nr:hypothetical protein [Psychroserpens damuponensis]